MYTKYSRARKGFVLDGVVLGGVHKCIQELFFPAYHRELARFGTRDAAPKAAGTMTVKPVVDLSSSSSRSNSPARRKKHRSPFAYQQEGMKIGRKVDQELKDLCKVKPKTRIKRLPLLHEQTRKILAALNEEKLGLDRAQVKVGSLQYRIGTAIDLVCIDLEAESKLPVIIEVKSGWKNDYFRYTRYTMSEPYEDRDDSPANQHQIQLALNVALYCLSYYDYKYAYENMQNMKAFVIRAIPYRDAVDVIPLKKWARDRIPNMLQAILQGSSNRLLSPSATVYTNPNPTTSSKHTRETEEHKPPVSTSPPKRKKVDPIPPTPIYTPPTRTFSRITL